MEVKKLKELGSKLVENSIISTMGYVDERGYPVSKAMIVLKHEGMKDFWFFTKKSSRKVQHFSENAKSSLYFQDLIEHAGLSLVGDIAILDDLKTKKKFWQDSLLSAFTGADDPELLIIKFMAFKGTYFDSRNSYEFSL